MKRLWLALLLLAVSAGPARADITLHVGESCTVSAFEVNVWVYGGELTVAPGGEILDLTAYGGKILIQGGRVHYITAYGITEIDLESGWVLDLYPRDQVDVEVSGGYCGTLRPWGHATVYWSGGNVASILCHERGRVNTAWGWYQTSEGIFNYAPGDASMDGITNALDYVVVSNHYGTGSTWADGDVNNDGVVNALDYVTISNHYGAHLPEPASMVLLFVGAGLLCATVFGKAGLP